jgi:hypothetical protein
MTESDPSSALEQIAGDLARLGKRRIPLLLVALAACNAPPSGPATAASETPTAPPPVSASPSATASPIRVAAVAPDFSPPPAPSSAPPLSPRGLAERQLDFDAQSARIDREVPHHLPIRTEDGTFLIVAAEPSAPLDAAASVVHDTVTALFHGPFAHRGERAFVVWVFKDPTHYGSFLLRHAPSADPKTLGYYDPDGGDIFVCTGGAGVTTVAHEVTHSLLGSDGDFPLAPRYLQEGVASLFELPDFKHPPGEIHGLPHFRLATLRRLLSGPDAKAASAIRLEALFADDPSMFFGPDAYIGYAVSREAMRWLDAQHKLWSFYRTFRDNVLDDRSGERSFTAVIGKTPAEATPEWLAWLRSPEAEQP